MKEASLGRRRFFLIFQITRLSEYKYSGFEWAIVANPQRVDIPVSYTGSGPWPSENPIRTLSMQREITAHIPVLYSVLALQFFTDIT